MKERLSAKDRLIIALDVPGMAEAVIAVEKLSSSAGWFKVGSQLFTSVGPRIIEEIKSAGAKVFLDLKFHDIPTTVALAGQAAVDLGVDLFNVHAMGGSKMMTETVRFVSEHSAASGKKKPLVIAVTVLTSMKGEDLSEIGVGASPADMALSLALLAKSCGLDGVVASAEEAANIKEKADGDFLVVTPGIRPAWAARDDQSRIKTPAQAIREGADLLVVGRPVLKAADPAEAVMRVMEEIESAL